MNIWDKALTGGESKTDPAPIEQLKQAEQPAEQTDMNSIEFESLEAEPPYATYHSPGIMKYRIRDADYEFQFEDSMLTLDKTKAMAFEKVMSTQPELERSRIKKSAPVSTPTLLPMMTQGGDDSSKGPKSPPARQTA